MKLHERPDTGELRDFKKVLFAWAAERNDSAEAMWDYCFAIADRGDATQNLDRVGTARAAVDLISNSWKRSGWPLSLLPGRSRTGPQRGWAWCVT